MGRGVWVYVGWEGVFGGVRGQWTESLRIDDFRV